MLTVNYLIFNPYDSRQYSKFGHALFSINYPMFHWIHLSPIPFVALNEQLPQFITLIHSLRAQKALCGVVALCYQHHHHSLRKLVTFAGVVL